MLRKFLLSCKLITSGSLRLSLRLKNEAHMKLISISTMLWLWNPSTPSHSTHEQTTKHQSQQATHKGCSPECKLGITEALLFSGENSPPRICHLATILCLHAIPAPSETSISPWVLTGSSQRTKSLIVVSPVSPLNNEFSKTLKLLSSPHISTSYNMQREKEIQE